MELEWKRMRMWRRDVRCLVGSQGVGEGQGYCEEYLGEEYYVIFCMVLNLSWIDRLVIELEGV